MAGPKNSYADVIAAWGSSALRPVELPTGMKALVKLPDVNELVKAEKLPNDLRDLAAKYATEGIDVRKLEGPELIRFIRLTYDLISRTIRYMAPPTSSAWDEFKKNGASPEDEGWIPVALTSAQIEEMDVDQADLEALAKIAGRQMTPNAVTAISRMDRGLITREEAAVIAGVESEVVGAYAGFRGQPGSPDDGADGEDVRDSSVGDDGDQGSGNRVRSRRGDRAPTRIRRGSRS